MQASYSFPLLRPSEILQCMSDLQIAFNEEDLAKPQSKRILNCYEAFTEIFMGVSRESFSSSVPNFAVMEMLDHPDLHNDSLSLMGFYRQL